MEGLSEVQALRHLLEVVQNILYNIGADEAILAKYQTIKKDTISKIKTQKRQSKILDKRFADMYRNLVDGTITCLCAFERQIEFLQEEKQVDNRFGKAIIDFKNKQSENIEKVLEATLPKKRQEVKEEINNCQYQFKELLRQFENLELVSKIQAKMQQIITQAAQNEKKSKDQQRNYIKKVEQLEDRVQILQRQLERVKDAEDFIEKYQLTKNSREQLHIIQREIRKLVEE